MSSPPDGMSRRRALVWGALAAATLGTAACSRVGASSAAAGSAPAGPGPSRPSPSEPVVSSLGPAPVPGLDSDASGSSPSTALSTTATASPIAARSSVRPTSAGRRSSPPAPVVPDGGPLWSAPVYTLAEYTARFPSVRFPADSIMLTIDDGPDPTWTPKILALLARYDVKATFCVIGREAAEHPTLVRAAAGEGHHLANHTFSHPISLPKLAPARIAAEMIDTQDAIVRAAGVTPRLFRSPGGNWGPAVFGELATRDLVPLDWDVDPRDWSRPGTAHITTTMLAAGPGDIVLCHDGGGDRSETYAALATVVPTLKARGLRFVTFPA